MLEMTALKPENFLHSLNELAATGMKQKAIEVRQAEAIAIEKIVQRRRQGLAHQRRQFGAQHDAKSVILDIPTHDVFGVRPAPFTNGQNARSAMRALRSVPQHDSGRAVAKQGGGNKHRRTRTIDAQAKTAKIDG